ncbi:MAG: hypothetical protein LBU23_10545 [Planctomycetota bacterium]|jgi:L-alanine-DL-glutamate epimerase-like enolase superfamily enzyme|nr:hypothetical protein [Planctomycetota bacterium]
MIDKRMDAFTGATPTSGNVAKVWGGWDDVGNSMTHLLMIENGRTMAPDAPGIGVEFSYDRLEAYRERI